MKCGIKIVSKDFESTYQHYKQTGKRKYYLEILLKIAFIPQIGGSFESEAYYKVNVTQLLLYGMKRKKELLQNKLMQDKKE